MTHAYRDLSVARGSSLQMLLPMAAGIGGFLFLGETFSLLEIAGGALTMLATWQILRQPPAPHPRPAAGSP